jgi:hypothetical protein
MFSSATGCDSLVTLALTVNPAYNETDAATICQGDAYTFGTQILTTAGTYTESFNSVNGCDSTVVLSLAVSGTYNETASATICQGGSYSFGTQTLTTAGSYTELFSSTSGCDSTVLLTLTVVNSYNETDAVTICLGSNYTFGTQTLSSAGTYTEVFNSVDGCDSTVVLTLSVTTAFNETDAASICQGNTYTFGTQSLTTSGTYTELFTSSGGCDSTVVLTLVVNTEFNETDAATICQGDTYSFGTQALTTAGTYTEMFISSGGCDSTVVLTLAVNPSYNINQSATICQGESYSLGSQLLTASGTYTEIFTTMAGCDSTIVLTLTVNSAYNETANATICSGDSYSFGSQTLTSAGTYTEMFSTASGCDSLVVLALNVIPAYNETDFATICNGDSYVFGTLTLTSGGTYSQTFQSTGGCDSTVALTLTVLPSYTTTESATICEGDTYIYPDGSSGTVTEAHVSVMTGSNGCDSTIVTALTVNPSYTINESATMCAGDTYTFPDGTTSTIAATNTSLFTTSNGCDSTIITALSIQAIDNSVTVVDVTITANQTGATYQWIDCDNGNVPINGEVGQSFTPTATIGNYAVIVTIGNCSETSDCTLIDRSSIEDIVENSISIYPNPVTDNLTIDWEGAVTRIEITDTKGKLLYVEEVSAVQSHQMSTETYSKGVYFIHVLTNEGRYVFDVVKQ